MPRLVSDYFPTQLGGLIKYLIVRKCLLIGSVSYSSLTSFFRAANGTSMYFWFTHILSQPMIEISPFLFWSGLVSVCLFFLFFFPLFFLFPLF